jgi:hypothetical protein
LLSFDDGIIARLPNPVRQQILKHFGSDLTSVKTTKQSISSMHELIAAIKTILDEDPGVDAGQLQPPDVSCAGAGHGKRKRGLRTAEPEEDVAGRR